MFDTCACPTVNGFYDHYNIIASPTNTVDRPIITIIDRDRTRPYSRHPYTITK